VPVADPLRALLAQFREASITPSDTDRERALAILTTDA